MNPEICKRCKMKPDFYRVDFIENQIMRLEGLKVNNDYTISRICYLHITDKEQIDKIEEEMVSLTFKEGEFQIFKPEEVYNKNNEVDETCCYYAEHQLNDWNENK